MSKKQQLLELYTNNLAALKCVAGEDGFLTYLPTDDPLAMEQNGKDLRLALPTDNILQILSASDIAAFHPLSENILLGQSPIINLMREVVNHTLSQNIMACVVTIASAVNQNTKFNIKQAEWLGGIEKVDDKFVNSVIKIAERLDPKGEHRVINVYLKHGGILHEDQYNRICTVNFPMYSQLLERPTELFGVKLRKGDVDLFLKIIERVIPHIEVKDHYSTGSLDLTAPYYDALMRSHAKVQEVLNKPGKLFGKLIYSLSGCEVRADLSYMKSFAHLGDLKSVIPPLKYNQGVEPSGSVPATPETTVPTPPPVQETPTMTPHPQSAPVPATQAPAPQLKPKPLGIMKLGADKNDGPGANHVPTGYQPPQAQPSIQQLAYPPEVYGAPPPPAYPQAYPQYGRPPSYPPAPGYPQPQYPAAPPPQPYYAGGPTMSNQPQYAPPPPVYGAPQPYPNQPYGYPQPQYPAPAAPPAQYNKGYPVFPR